MRDYSLYVHVPFCSKKCDYCDFYSVPLSGESGGCVDNEYLLDKYIERVLEDFHSLLLQYQPDFIPSVFIGGGTPSILGAQRIRRLLFRLSEQITKNSNTPHSPHTEITVEANPESTDKDFLSACRESGVNRVSIGVQSFHEPSRAAVHRTGTLSAAEIEAKIALVAEFFPGSFSVDLISGLPIQTETVLRNDIDRVLAFNPGHISLYALTLAEGTPLYNNISGNTFSLRRRDAENAEKIINTKLHNTDEADALWLYGRDYLTKAGYEQYEVSNFSLKGRRCLHNIRYWRMENWLGIGPGASGTVIDGESGGTAGRRFTVKANLEKWLKNSDSCVQEEILDSITLMKETLLMGFRYIEGPDPELFRKRFGTDIDQLIPITLEQWLVRGCMAANNRALNKDGLLFLNKFLSDAFEEIDLLGKRE